MKPETPYWKFELTDLTKPRKTRGLTGTGQGLAHNEAAGWILRWVWNRTNLFLGSKPGPLADYPVPLLTLAAQKASICHFGHIHGQLHVGLF